MDLTTFAALCGDPVSDRGFVRGRGRADASNTSIVRGGSKSRMLRHNVATPLTRMAEGIDRLIAVIGRAVIWLSLLLVLLQFAVVLLRYLFAIGSIWLSESIIYTHAALFLLAAAWTLQQNGHARVDVFYADGSARTKAVVDLLGSLLLLLPFMGAILWYALPYV